MRRLLVIDIETMACENPREAFKPFAHRLKAGRGSNPLNEGRMIMEKVEEIVTEKAALSPTISRILCIGVQEALVNDVVGEFTIELEKWHFICDADEKSMLEQLAIKIDPRTEFVTFNGRAFDFPFINFRAAVRGVRFSQPLPFYQYNGRDNHYDLYVQLGDTSLLENLDSTFKYPPSLGAWINYFGIPVQKKSIAKGEINLPALFAAGNYAAIEEYVKGDVVATWELFKRFRYTFNSYLTRFDNGTRG